MMISLDGFVAGPNDEMDWIDNDPVMGEAHFSLAQGADSAIVGHSVYQGMAQFWPAAAAESGCSEQRGGVREADERDAQDRRLDAARGSAVDELRAAARQRRRRSRCASHEAEERAGRGLAALRRARELAAPH